MNANPIKFILATMAGTALLLAGLPAYVSPETRPEQEVGRLKKHDPSLLVSAQSVLQRLKQGQKIILVDVRDSAEFKRVGIPGAINIPLHFVQTKAFLEARPVVLVAGGYPDSQVEAECQRLHNKGFNVSILSGGLIAWHRHGGPVQGDLLFLNPYKTISPLQLYQNKDRPNQIIINVSEKQHPESMQLMPSAKHIPVQVRSQTAISQVKKSILKLNINPSSPVIILNRTGKQYEQIENILKQAGLKNTYYLEGGLNGYQRFLRHLALSRQSRESRLKTTSQCPSCGSGGQKAITRETPNERKTRNN